MMCQGNKKNPSVFKLTLEKKIDREKIDEG